MSNWSWRRLQRVLKRIPDRLAHNERRQRALELLSAPEKPRSVLVVCHGNLCRSPYTAAAILKRFETAGAPIVVESAGFFSSNRIPPHDALAAAAERGIDMSAHRSRALTSAMLEAADLILVMDPRQSMAVAARRRPMTARVVVLGDLDPERIRTREIVDPFGDGRAAFDFCYARIDRCVAELVRVLLASTGRPSGAT